MLTKNCPDKEQCHIFTLGAIFIAGIITVYVYKSPSHSMCDKEERAAVSLEAGIIDYDFSVKPHDMP